MSSRSEALPGRVENAERFSALLDRPLCREAAVLVHDGWISTPGSNGNFPRNDLENIYHGCQHLGPVRNPTLAFGVMSPIRKIEGRGLMAKPVLVQISAPYLSHVDSVPKNATSHHMGSGRVIRIRKHRGDSKGIAYIVAMADSVEASALIRRKVAASGDEIEDLGRVSEALVGALGLSDGDFVRIDETHRRNPVCPEAVSTPKPVFRRNC